MRHVCLCEPSPRSCSRQEHRVSRETDTPLPASPARPGPRPCWHSSGTTVLPASRGRRTFTSRASQNHKCLKIYKSHLLGCPAGVRVVLLSGLGCLPGERLLSVGIAGGRPSPQPHFYWSLAWAHRETRSLTNPASRTPRASSCWSSAP